jgi:hypothetical protein
LSDPLYDIVQAAAELKMQAPREYDRFIAAFKIFEDRLTTELRAAGPNVIFTAQGKSQLVTRLRQKLEDCLTIKSVHDKRQ